MHYFENVNTAINQKNNYSLISEKKNDDIKEKMGYNENILRKGF